MKSVVFRGISGVWRPSRKGRGAVGTALVAASGVAALAFAPSAQAAGSPTSYNVMLTKAPIDVGSVSVWDYAGDDTGTWIGCYTVQSGREKNMRYKVSVGHFLRGNMYGDGKCSSTSGYKGTKDSVTVSSNLGTTNFWFALS